MVILVLFNSNMTCYLEQKFRVAKCHSELKINKCKIVLVSWSMGDYYKAGIILILYMSIQRVR